MVREDIEGIKVMGFWYWLFCRIGAYRFTMKFMHKRNWHYAKIIGPIEPDGNYQRWCQWCGFRQTYNHHPNHLPRILN